MPRQGSPPLHGTPTDGATSVFSLLAAVYVAFLALDSHVFRLEWTGLDGVRELLTIPLIPPVPAAVVVSVVQLPGNRRSVNACRVGSALPPAALNCLIRSLWRTARRPYCRIETQPRKVACQPQPCLLSLHGNRRTRDVRLQRPGGSARPSST